MIVPGSLVGVNYHKNMFAFVRRVQWAMHVENCVGSLSTDELMLIITTVDDTSPSIHNEGVAFVVSAHNLAWVVTLGITQHA